MHEQLMTTGEAARRLSIPRHRLLYLFESGQIPEPTRIGGRRMIGEPELRHIAAKLAQAAEQAVVHERV